MCSCNQQQPGLQMRQHSSLWQPQTCSHLSVLPVVLLVRGLVPLVILQQQL
jgi:hypothetical protein